MKLVKDYYLYVCIAIFALVLRLINLASPKAFIMDEAYYVPDSISLLKNGYEAKIASGLSKDQVLNKVLDNDYSFFDLSGYGATHPPLGKMMISIGMIFFGTSNPVGWRLASVIAGTVIVIATMALAYIVFRNKSISLIAGAMVAIDPMAIAMSKTAHLDIFLAMFAIVGFTFLAVYVKNRLDNISYPIFKSVWLFLGFVSLGLATAVKWSGLYFVFFGIIVFVGFNLYISLKHPKTINIIKLSIEVTLLGFVSLLVYLLSWIPWLFTIGKNINPIISLQSLLGKHVALYYANVNLTEKHNYNSNAFEWVLQAKPTLLYYKEVTDSSIISVSSLPNLLLWVGSIVALVVTVIFLVRRVINNKIVYIIFAAILAGWLPWMISYGRTIFQFYTVVFEPYLYILLAFVLYVAWIKVNMREKKINILRMFLLIFIFVSVVFSFRVYSGSVGIEESKSNGSYSIFTQWQHFTKDAHIYDINQMPEETIKQ